MGLIDLQTDLKSLKYSTVPGNGTGPIIQKGIPLTQTSTIGYSADYAFQGQGFLPALEDDILRIGGWFNQNRGNWALKQSTLESFNPKTESDLITRVPDALGINAIASTGGSPLGIYLAKNGIAGFIPEDSKHEANVRENNNDKKNRLVELTNRFIYQNTSQTLSFLGPLSGFANNVSEFFNPDDSVLFSYVGGPGGPITTIRRASNQNGTNTFSTSFGFNQQIVEEQLLSSLNPFIQKNTYLEPYVIEEDKTIPGGEIRSNIFPKIFGLARSQPTSKTRVEYNSQIENPNSDKINLLKVGETSENTSPEIRDLIKFKFRAINNDTPTQETPVQFRAYLTGISDNFNPQWDSVKYVGRGEEFYNYTGFSRDINFNLAFAALTKQELTPLYNKINYLASLTAPDYNNSYIRGNIVKLTIGDYIDNQPGIINSLTYNIEDNTPWEINLESDWNTPQLPHVLRAQISMKLIHNGLPKKGYNFIGIDGFYDPFLPIAETQIREVQPIENSIPEGQIKGTRPTPNNLQQIASTLR